MKQPNEWVKEMMPDIDQTQNKQQAIEEYMHLLNVPGWMRLTKVLKTKIDSLQHEILDTDVQGEELNRLRDRRDLCLWFANCPEILMGILGEDMAEVADVDLDPYEATPIIQGVDNLNVIG